MGVNEVSATREELKRLLDDLSLAEVKMKSGMFECNELPDDEDKIQIQGYNNLLEVTHAGGEDFRVYVFRYGCGVRLINREDIHNQDAEPYFEVIGEFEAVYNANHEHEENILVAFGRAQAGRDIWPYWREFAQSSAQRMDIQELRIGNFPNPSMEG